MPFKQIQKQVMQSILSQNVRLFQVQVEHGELFEAYITALPEHERQEHRCSACRSFINHYGHIVAIIDNQVQTIWDFELDDEYTDVPQALRKIVLNRPIVSRFISKQSTIGVESNIQLVDGKAITWGHFAADLHRKNTSRDPSASIGDQNTRQTVFHRALSELTLQSVDTVLELIAQNTLYRGEQHEAILKKFQEHLLASAPPIDRQLYALEHLDNTASIRNSAIGTLLIDLSAGTDLENAVRKYEAVVAPTNYKRSKALVTPRMIEQAQDKLAELGFEKAIFRRHATAADIPLKNLHYVYREATNKLEEPNPFDTIAKKVAPKKQKAELIGIAEFLHGPLSGAQSVELLMESRLSPNLISLVAPKYANAPSLFPWPSGISWDYNGNVTDSIQDKVMKAGGKVTGYLRASLEWFNTDDLDIHIELPDGRVLYFGEREVSGGKLDVDANASNLTSAPVENIVFSDKGRMQEGEYIVKVHQYSKRNNDPKTQGFNLQIECQDKVIDLSYPAMMRSGIKVTAATFDYSHKKGITNFRSNLDNEASNKNLWGIDTNRYHRVNMVMDSPNYWGGDQYGNRHTFFILEDVKNEEAPRGFYNEFLAPSLHDHRKVFEVLAASMKVEENKEQLSGLGFSSTQDTHATFKVDGKVYSVAMNDNLGK